jgi:hypothetical protein
LLFGISLFGLTEKEHYADLRISLQSLQRRLREAGLRIESRGRLREVRLEQDGEAHVALRHGQVFERVLPELIKRLGVRRLLVIVLRGMPLTLRLAAAAR